jgi:putative PIN family toxin of toxin-antitoxin system
VRIVLDTNVAVSALLWRGTAYQLLQAIRHRPGAQIYSSPALLAELLEVLSRPFAVKRLALIGRAAREVLADYVEAVELVEPSAVPRVVPDDADDDQVLTAALAAQVDLIVSGDRHLLDLGDRYQGIPIASPARAVGLVASG